MSADQIAQIIIHYRYWILIPLSMIEGPIVAFTAGMLASLGYFNIFALGVFFFARDMLMDAFYYAIGYFGGHTRVARRMLNKLGVEQSHLQSIRTIWEKRLGITMFVGKLSYGIASSFVVFAGAVNMPLRRFFGWSAIVAITQFWTLLAFGYYFGATFYSGMSNSIGDILYAIGGITLLTSTYYLLSLYARKHLKKHTEQKYPHSAASRPTSLRMQ